MSRNGNGEDEGKDEAERPYEVGYGRPPKDKQFKPGQSGNSKGRRKGSKSYSQIVKEVFCEELTIMENGRRLKVMALEVMLKKTRNLAISGKMDAQREAYKQVRDHLIVQLDKDAERAAVADMPNFSKMTIEELEILQDAAAIFHGKKERPPPPLPPGYRWINEKAVLLNPRTGEPYDEEEQ
jgi:hypothetical protein